MKLGGKKPKLFRASRGIFRDIFVVATGITEAVVLLENEGIKIDFITGPISSNLVLPKDKIQDGQTR